MKYIPDGFYAVKCQLGTKEHKFDPELALNVDFMEWFCQLIQNHLIEESNFVLMNNTRSTFAIEDIYRHLNLKKAFEKI